MLASLNDEAGYAALVGPYSRLSKPEFLLGNGGFSQVLRFQHATQGAMAVKRTFRGAWRLGLPATSLRECGVLQELGSAAPTAPHRFALLAAPPFVLKGRVFAPLVDADCDLGTVLQRLRDNGAAALRGEPGVPSLPSLASALCPSAVVPWLCTSALAAAAALAEAGWVHRDLKPENILLCPRQELGGGGSSGIVLCDFGTAEPAPGSQVGCTAA